MYEDKLYVNITMTLQKINKKIYEENS